MTNGVSRGRVWVTFAALWTLFWASVPSLLVAKGLRAASPKSPGNEDTPGVRCGAGLLSPLKPHV